MCKNVAASCEMRVRGGWIGVIKQFGKESRAANK